jgi:hypothetical protein
LWGAQDTKAKGFFLGQLELSSEGTFDQLAPGFIPALGVGVGRLDHGVGALFCNLKP